MIMQIKQSCKHLHKRVMILPRLSPTEDEAKRDSWKAPDDPPSKRRLSALGGRRRVFATQMRRRRGGQRGHLVSKFFKGFLMKWLGLHLPRPSSGEQRPLDSGRSIGWAREAS